MKKKFIVRLLSVEIVVFAALLTVYVLILLNDGTVNLVNFKGTESVSGAEIKETLPIETVAFTETTEDKLKQTEETAEIIEPAEENVQAGPITITFCGDILLDSSVKRRMYEGGREAVFPISHAQPFTEADITMINLEFPFSTRGAPMPDKEYTFRGDPEHISFFTEMGTDIVSLANNHVLDYGYDAFLDTLDLLDENEIKYVGAGRNLSDAKRYEIFEVKGKKIAFLSASRVIPVVDWYANSTKPGVFATYDPAALNEQIALAKEEADYVIVYVHWGVERNTKPEGYQISMARGYIENGADAVIGSHPHVLQGFEIFKGKPIVYSLGNFVFTDAKKDTMAVTLTLEEELEPVVAVIPYQINDRKTTLMEDEALKQTLKGHLESISFGVEIGDDWVVRQKEQ